MQTDRERLRQLIEQKCLIVSSDFTLSTGVQSSFYFDCKVATLNGECASLIAQEVLREIEEFPTRPAAIGGLTIGADFIVATVVMKAYEAGQPTQHGSIVRKEPKKHGTKNRIENQLPPGTKIVVVDDVITSGRSTIQACDEFEQAGYEIIGIIGLVDREAGGAEELAKRYRHVRTLFSKSDFPSLSNNGNVTQSRPAAQV
jgi:orotate phosphoribosyltransferase